MTFSNMANPEQGQSVVFPSLIGRFFTFSAPHRGLIVRLILGPHVTVLTTSLNWGLMCSRILPFQEPRQLSSVLDLLLWGLSPGSPRAIVLAFGQFDS